MGLRSDSYYTAARDRIKEARFLHENRFYALAMYVSGLAVECMLRAFRLLKDPTFDERHDLWRLWKSTELANVRKKIGSDRGIKGDFLKFNGSFGAPTQGLEPLAKETNQIRTDENLGICGLHASRT